MHATSHIFSKYDSKTSGFISPYKGGATYEANQAWAAPVLSQAKKKKKKKKKREKKGRKMTGKNGGIGRKQVALF